MSRRFWLFAAAAGAALTANSQALAQDSNEIVVTATRRESALQDVPIAVTPVTAAAVQNSGIRDLQDLTSVVSSLQFNVSENETSATARLRGVGTQGSNPGLESAVGVFIDGVYRARNGVALTDLGEVERIEVLRGPQGTLFGRNTSAGLITIQTAGPEFDEFSFGGEATYGEFNETRIAGHVNIPIAAESAALRIFAASSKRDGLLDMNPAGANPTLGAASDANLGTHETNTRELWTVRGQFLVQMSPNVDLRIIADYTDRDEACCAAQPYAPNLLGANRDTATGSFFPFPASPAAAIAAIGGYGAGGVANIGNGDIGRHIGFANRDYGQGLTDWGVSGELTWHLNWATLTSITAYRDWEYDQGTDADYSQADLWYRPSNGTSGFGFEDFTQEIRLAGTSGPVDWLVGVFYSDETVTRKDNLTNGVQFNNYWPVVSAALWTPFGALNTALDNSHIDDHYEQSGSSLAFFTHNIVAFSERTHATVGLRLTHEEKDLTADFNTVFNGAFTSGARLFYDNRATIAGGGFNALLSSLGPAGACNNVSSIAGTATFGTAQQVYCLGTLNPSLDAQVFTQSREETEFSGVLSLHHEFSDAVSGYLSVSRGYKAGGFNLDRNYDGYLQTGANSFTITYQTGFEPEFVTAYEAGLKTTLFGGSLLMNWAAFINEYENFQLNTFNGVSFQISPIPEVDSVGGELDLIWRTPVEGLTIQGGAAYVTAEYGKDTGWVTRSFNPYSRIFVLGRLPEQQLTNAPVWSSTGSATLDRPIFGGAANFLAYADFRWVSDQVTGSDLNPAKEQPSYWLVNARLGLSSPEEHFALEVWGRNLLDQDYQQIAFDTPLQSGSANALARTYSAFLGDPRTFGVTLRVKY